MSLALVVGMVLVGAFLTYFSFQLEPEHAILKLLLIVFIMILALIIVPKNGVDQVCDIVVANSTDVSSTVTTYEYDSFCYTPSSNTGVVFYRWGVWLFRLFMAYLILYLGYIGLNIYYDWRKKKQGRE